MQIYLTHISHFPEFLRILSNGCIFFLFTYKLLTRESVLLFTQSKQTLTRYKGVRKRVKHHERWKIIKSETPPSKILLVSDPRVSNSLPSCISPGVRHYISAAFLVYYNLCLFGRLILNVVWGHVNIYPAILYDNVCCLSLLELIWLFSWR